MALKKRFSENQIKKMLSDLSGGCLHHMQEESISNATLGALTSYSMVVHHIGRGLATHLGKTDKHAIKQVDRLLSNKKIVMSALLQLYVPFVLGSRKNLTLSLDWTSYHKDDQMTLVLSLVTSHGRSIPVMWRTFRMSRLKGRQSSVEMLLLRQFRNMVAADVNVKIIADRGFCSVELMKYLDSIRFKYVIRVKQNLYLCDEYDEGRDVTQWLAKYRRYPRLIQNAKITNQLHEVATVVFTKDTKSGEPWVIVSNVEGISKKELLHYYSKRWGCEPTFRDTKDLKFGMGLSKTHIGTPARRDRLLLINALALLFLTTVGAACEKIGFTKKLQANTTKKKRVLSLVRQGAIFLKRLADLPRPTFMQFRNAFHEIFTERLNFKGLWHVV